MLLHNYIAKYYDVHIQLPAPASYDCPAEVDTLIMIDVLGQEDTGEPIGWFIPVVSAYETRYDYVRIYGPAPCDLPVTRLSS